MNRYFGLSILHTLETNELSRLINCDHANLSINCSSHTICSIRNGNQSNRIEMR